MRKSLSLVLISLILLLVGCSSGVSPARDDIINNCEAKYGLSNVKVDFTRYTPQIDTSIKFYKVIITCDGFSNLDYSEMYSCFLKIDDANTGGNRVAFTCNDITIISDGHSYTYRNGDSEFGESGYVYCDDSIIYEQEYKKPLTSDKVSSGDNSAPVDSGVRHSNAEAFTIAESIVEENLKAPSTASFCKVTEATITNNGDVYTVSGWVDAQNSFGAMLRQNFTVTYTALKKGNDIGYKNGSVIFSE